MDKEYEAEQMDVFLELVKKVGLFEDVISPMIIS